MPQGHLETVRAVYDEWAKGNFRAGADLYDPLAVLVQGRGFPEAGAHVGLEGIREYMHRFLEAWDRVTIEAEDLVAIGDTVVVAVVQRAAGRGSGAPGELRYFQLWSFRGDRVIRLDTIRERDAAFAAAGSGDQDAAG
jgi:ketosteroid isomerase-like protein